MTETAITEQTRLNLEACRYCGRPTVYVFRICRFCQNGTYFAVVATSGQFEVVAVVESAVAQGDEDRVHISWALDRTTAERIAEDLYRAI